MKNCLSFISLRGRLLILVLISMIPVLVLLLYTASEQKRIAEDEIRVKTLDISKSASIRIEQLAQGSHNMLLALSELQEVRNYDAAACSTSFSKFNKHLPMYRNIFAVKPDGDFFCSVLPLKGKMNVSGRHWFQRTVQTGSFTFGEFHIGRVSSHPTICAALPIMDNVGKLKAVVAAGFNLESFNEQLSTIQIPKESAILVLDRDGTVISGHPDPGKWLGTNVADTGLVKTIFTQKEGTVEAVGLDGTRRIFSFVPVKGTGDGMFVAFGISPEIAYASVNHMLQKSLLLLLIAALITASIAWFGADFIIMRKMQKLTKAANELANGNHGARVDITDGKDEIGQLGRSFNNMAVALERDISDRKQALEAMTGLRMQNELILNSVGEGIFGLDLDGNSTFINPAAAKMLGYEVAELIGKNPHLMFHHSKPDGSLYPEEECPILAAYKDGVTRGEENEVYWRKDGSSFPVRYISTPILEGDKIKGAVVSFRDITERKLAEEKLRNLYANLQSMREEERASIAREIHDELGQVMAAIKMDVAWINSKCKDCEGIAEKAAATLNHIDATIKSIKKICTELRPGILDHLGIVAAIKWQAEEFESRTGIQCEINAHEDIRLNRDHSTVLFRIFQEALTNVVRHANATKIVASLKEEDSMIILEISDNGEGISETDISKPNSFGLMGMRERVYPWKGKVNISGSPGSGTRIEVILPIAEVGV
jgi:PAS domain S-box-containing protein